VAKSKAVQTSRKGETQKRSGIAGPKSAARASATGSSDTYELCMKAYRWTSKRYRKTLDKLAK